MGDEAIEQEGAGTERRKIWWKAPGPFSNYEPDEYEWRQGMVWVWVAIFFLAPILGNAFFGDVGLIIGLGITTLAIAFGTGYALMALAYVMVSFYWLVALGFVAFVIYAIFFS